MGCYHPIRAFVNIKNHSAECKKIIRFKPQRDLENWREITLPCGQCIGCRLEYSRQWALRIQKEATLYKDNYFLTITYDQEHLPWIDTINEETGELILGNPLIPKHFTKFMKDLREYWDYHYKHQGIRFYGCGEYGEKHERPHYHICLMNFPIPEEELEFEKNNELGDALYKCQLIEDIWGKGLIRIGALTWQSAAYVARYILKKQKGECSEEIYRSKGQIPEFTRMSRKPGIGKGWYEENRDEIYKNDEVFVPRRGGGATKLKPARYFDRIYDLEKPARMMRIKEARRAIAEKQQRLKLAKTSAEIHEILENAERIHKERSKILLRKLE